MSVAEYHLDDVRYLKRSVAALKDATDDQIEDLYHEYSDEVCASWLIVTAIGIKHFEKWLKDRKQ